MSTVIGIFFQIFSLEILRKTPLILRISAYCGEFFPTYKQWGAGGRRHPKIRYVNRPHSAVRPVML